MTVESAQITVTTTPTALNVGEDPLEVGRVVRDGKIHLFIHDLQGGASVFVGPAGVTSSTGYEIETGVIIELDLFRDEALYAVTASGTQDVHVLRTGVGV